MGGQQEHMANQRDAAIAQLATALDRIDLNEMRNASERAQLTNAARSFASVIETEILRGQTSAEVAGQLSAAQRRVLSDCCGRVAAIATLGSDDALSSTMRADELAVAVDDVRRAAWRALLHAPPEHLEVRQVIDQIRYDETGADVALRQLKRSADSPEVRALGKQLLRRGRPVPMRPEGWPLSWSMGLVGVVLLGWADRVGATVVKTRFAMLGFLPVWPIDRYRVTRTGMMQYTVHAKYPLSPLLLLWRGVAVAGVLGLFVSMCAGAEDTSPRHLAEVAIARAQSLEGSGQSEMALEAYNQAYEQGRRGRQILAAARGIVRLSVDAVPSPFTLADVPAAEAAIARSTEVSAAARDNTVRPYLGPRIAGWAADIGTETPAAAEGVVALFNAAQRANAMSAELRALVGEARAVLADASSAGWPLVALEQYVGLPVSPQSTERLNELLLELSRYPLALDERRDLLARVQVRGAGIEAAQAALDAFDELVADPERAVEMQGGLDALQQYADAHPEDHGAAYALAEERWRNGDLEGAEAALQRLGEVNVRPGYTLVLASRLYAARGQYDEALEVLRHYVGHNLRRMSAASMALNARENELYEQARRNSRAGQLPQDIAERMNSNSGEEIAAAFTEYRDRLIKGDPDIARHSATLAWLPSLYYGMLAQAQTALNFAQIVGADERAALLSEASDVLSDASQWAEGDAQFLVIRGAVHHALERPDEGNADFEAALEVGGAALQSTVGIAYAEVGATARARALLYSATMTAPNAVDPQFRAMLIRTLFGLATTTEQRAEALALSTPDDPLLLAERLSLQAEMLRLQGEDLAAGAVFAELAEACLAEGAIAEAAVALTAQYTCTGELEVLEQAGELLRAALVENPHQAWLLSFLSTTYAALAVGRTVEHWIPDQSFRMNSDEAVALLLMLGRGAEGDAVRSHLAEALATLDEAHSGVLDASVTVLAPEAIGARVHLLRALEDDSGLLALRDELASAGTAGVPAIDEADRVSQRSQEKRWAEVGVRRAEARLSRAMGQSSESADAARVLLGRALLTLFDSTLSLEDAERASAIFADLRSEHVEVSGWQLDSFVAAAAARCAPSGSARDFLLDQWGQFVRFAIRAHALASEDAVFAECMQRELSVPRVTEVLAEVPPDSEGGWLVALLRGDAAEIQPFAEAMLSDASTARREIRAALLAWDASPTYAQALAERYEAAE